MVDIKSIHRSYLIIIKVLLIVNIELTQYLRLHKFDQYCVDPCFTGSQGYFLALLCQFFFLYIF